MTHPYIYIATRANETHSIIWHETHPRHLAGRGDPRRITQTLRAAGWKNLSDPDYPHVVLASPDYRHTLVLEPEAQPYQPWWRIRGHSQDHGWYTEFGAHTPVEILAGLTDALISPEPTTMPADVWATLTSARWTYDRDERGNETATHPAGTLHLRRRTVGPGERFFWTAEAGLHHAGGGRDIVWQASLDDEMPPHLIAAFATALANHDPVQRGRGDVPHDHLVTQKERGPQGEELAAAHEARLKAVRAAARKARRGAAVTTRNGPVPATAPTPVVRGR
ncbi:DUF317 domain-containing protein [Streptomyces sp. NPDC056149]|uniref:DUF317 domain-containing protein n=1 Tax=Streptomyces sp. NPDC056149 TaxID=3345728 RepID=UPI0035D7A4D6